MSLFLFVILCVVMYYTIYVTPPYPLPALLFHEKSSSSLFISVTYEDEITRRQVFQSSILECQILKIRKGEHVSVCKLRGSVAVWGSSSVSFLQNELCQSSQHCPFSIQ
ncbi:unnamed protein product [Cuscuta europaea]|uniref:Uncharacterized protein n=1 Tax=Cuscuta europaea TaxID=41803 RepID=A0A9P1A134_CUSEU|nr:unnamed protein product [Cuscuta europaea]